VPALLGGLGGAVGVVAEGPVPDQPRELVEGVVAGQVDQQLLLAVQGLLGGPVVEGHEDGQVVPGDGPLGEGLVHQGQATQGPAPGDVAPGLGAGQMEGVHDPGPGRRGPGPLPGPRGVEVGHRPGRLGVHPGVHPELGLHGLALGITARITIRTAAHQDVHDHGHS
jgi:hypothetical protein